MIIFVYYYLEFVLKFGQLVLELDIFLEKEFVEVL